MEKEDGDVGHEEQLFKRRPPAHTHTHTQLAGSSLARTLKKLTPPPLAYMHTHTHRSGLRGTLENPRVLHQVPRAR